MRARAARHVGIALSHEASMQTELSGTEKFRRVGNNSRPCRLTRGKVLFLRPFCRRRIGLGDIELLALSDLLQARQIDQPDLVPR